MKHLFKFMTLRENPEDLKRLNLETLRGNQVNLGSCSREIC